MTNFARLLLSILAVAASPLAFAVVPLPGDATSIPTLSEWGVILLSVLVGLLAATHLRRRRALRSVMSASATNSLH